VTRIAAVALLLLGCTAVRTAAPQAAAIRIDHVIVGANDLEAAIGEMERLTGVRPVIGGVHPGRGTRNALMSLGDGTYLEILSPDPAQGVDNEELRELRALGRPTPIGWAVSASNEAALRSALSAANIATTQPVPGSRAKPDGSMLRWVTFGYSELDTLLAPFFIMWTDLALHPSRTSSGGCRLNDLTVESPQADAISRAVAPLGLGVTVKLARQDSMQLSLSCPKGEVGL
jgi:hypothetical protein